MALDAIRELREGLQFIAKLTGELSPQAAGENPLQVVIQYTAKPLEPTPVVLEALPAVPH